ncbi:MAG: hypothetical protein LBC64_02290 [Fibromonadaceae bacterium]|jgi:ADP-heptose:LPS heptosyltransferase|nr:hypothetical protein [Fibromonadaceae bacterium]
MDNYAKAKLHSKINKLIRNKKLDGKSIIIFGASIASKEIKNCLTEYGYSPFAVVDNDPRKIGKECLGLTIQEPEKLLLPFNDDYVILMCSAGFYREMFFQLSEMGYRKNKQVFSLNFNIDDSLKIFCYYTLRKIKAMYYHWRFTKKNCVMFVAPYTGIGDIYLAGLFFKEYLKRNNINEYVFVVVNGACKKVAEMFGIKNIIVTSFKAAEDLTQLNKSLRVQEKIITLNDGWASDPIQWIRGYKGLDFAKMFRYFVFDFDDNVQYELPPRKNWQSQIDELFKKHNLLKGKTIILSPYSNTLFELPTDFWESIVEHCKQRGYTICTNCAAKGEKPIKGTEAVFFPLGMAIDFVEAAGSFIGIRSGLCDVISSAKAKKIILYEKDGFFYKSSPYEYFSLKKMGLCDDAVELEYNFNEREKVMEKILLVY